MDFSRLPVIELMREKLAFLSERQKVLSQNVANADTPGYRALDIKTPDFSGELKQASGKLAMTSTHPAHIAGTGNASAFKEMKRPSTYETTPTDNNVVIQEEMMKMAQGQMEYQTVTNLYRKTLELFKTAIGRPT